MLLDFWGYDFLDRLETRGLFISEDFNMKPYPREAFAEIILQISEKQREQRNLLSATEQRLLERLKGEFYEELADLAPEMVVKTEEREPHLYSWQTDELSVHFEGTLREHLHFENKEDVDPGIPTSITSVGLGGRARLKKSMVIFVEGYTSALSSTDSLSNTVFNPALGLPVTKKALVDVAISDYAMAYMKFRFPWFDLELGRDLVEWGPGYHGKLLLSRSSNVYDLIKLSFRYRRAKFEYFHGFLNSDRAKYLAAHRMEIRPFRNLLLAVSEAVVYGDRDVEPLYLNPFVPMIISERHVGNQDNNMLGFDGALFLPAQRLKLYGEVLFDDFSLAKDIFGSFGNKWAIQAGLFWVNPFGLPDTGLRLEATRVQPFVYSHTRSEVNTLTNYNNPMGYWLGSDNDNVFVAFSHQASRDFRWQVSFENRRRGDTEIKLRPMPEDGRIKFLDGIVETARFYGLEGEWQFRRDASLSANYQFIQSDNLRRDADLDQSNHRLFLRFALRH